MMPQQWSPVEILADVWRDVPVEERLHFLAEHLTLQDRRELLVLSWDTAPEEQPPVPFLYTLGQRLHHAQRGWVGVVVRRRYTESTCCGPVVEYCLEFPEGEVLWADGRDVVPEPSRRRHARKDA